MKTHDKYIRIGGKWSTRIKIEFKQNQRFVCYWKNTLMKGIWFHIYQLCQLFLNGTLKKNASSHWEYELLWRYDISRIQDSKNRWIIKLRRTQAAKLRQQHRNGKLSAKKFLGHKWTYWIPKASGELCKRKKKDRHSQLYHETNIHRTTATI